MPGILKWDLGDTSNNVNLNSFTHTYNPATYGGTKNVKIYKGSTTSAGDITQIDLPSDNLVGTLDISSLTNLTIISGYSNPKLTRVLTPPSANSLVTFRFSDCSLAGVLDVSNLILGARFDVAGNKGLTGILNPSNNVIWSDGYYANNCDLTGTLDLRSLKGLGGWIWLNTNKKLTQVLTPSSSTNLSYFYVQDCSLSGTLDVSGLLIGGSFNAQNNNTLTNVIHRSCSTNFSTYSIDRCNLSTLDISCLTGMAGLFRCDLNKSLTKITMPIPKSGAEVLYYFNAADCSLNGTLDMSKTTNLGYSSSASGLFWVYNNKNLTQIKNPSTGNYIISYDANNCDLTGTFDASNLVNLMGYLKLNGNLKLTKIINPTSTGAFSSGYHVYDCSLIGTLDLSGLTGIGGQLRFENNTGLSKVVLPSTISQPITYIDSQNCQLDTDSIDNLLIKCASRWNSVLPTSNAFLYLQGGFNSPPINGSLNSIASKIHTIFDVSTIYDASIIINDGISDLLNFNSSVIIRPQGFALSGFGAGSYNISFDLYLDPSAGATAWGGSSPEYDAAILHLGDGTRDINLIVSRTKGMFYGYGDTGNSSTYICSLPPIRKKTRIDYMWNNTTHDVSLYYDGVAQAKTTTTNIGATGNALYIGGYNTSASTNSKNLTMWNFNFNGQHAYKGYPAGNTNAAWADTIGSTDISLFLVTGVTEKFTRYAITGVMGI